MALEQAAADTPRFADSVKASAGHGAEKGGIVALEPKEATGRLTMTLSHQTLTSTTPAGREHVICREYLGRGIHASIV